MHRGIDTASLCYKTFHDHPPHLTTLTVSNHSRTHTPISTLTCPAPCSPPWPSAPLLSTLLNVSIINIWLLSNTVHLPSLHSPAPPPAPPPGPSARPPPRPSMGTRECLKPGKHGSTTIEQRRGSCLHAPPMSGRPWGGRWPGEGGGGVGVGVRAGQ